MLALKIIFLSLIASSSPASVNDIFAELLGRPERGGVKAAYEFRQYETKAIGAHQLGLRQHNAQATVPLNSLSDRKWKLHLQGDADEICTNARFPNGTPLPRQVSNLGAGISYLRLTEGDRTIGGNFMLGSASNRPFGTFRELSFQSNFVYKIPKENEAAWIFFVNFSTNRSFLNYYPVPGAAYFFRPHPKLRLALGVPFFMMFWSPFEGGVMSASYYPLKNAQAKFSYFLFGPAHVFAQVKYDSKNYFLANRANKRERFFYDEAIASVGFSMPLERYLIVEASGGMSFERKYFLAEKARDWKKGQFTRPGKAPFASVRLVASF